MLNAQLITPAAVPTLTAFGLEQALVRFITTLFGGTYRLDNPTLNLAQPDVVPFDPTERAQTLEQKRAPRVVRGRIPRTITGEVAADKLPDTPNIIVQAVSAKVETPSTFVMARILFSAYDENADSQGYQDVLNMIEATAIALTSFGQGALEESFPIVLPLEWKMIEEDVFPHFIGELSAKFELPSARPLPDLAECFIPAEHIEAHLSNPEKT